MRFTDKTFLLLLPKIKSAGSVWSLFFIGSEIKTDRYIYSEPLTLSESLQRGDAGSLEMPRSRGMEVGVVSAALGHSVMILGIHWGLMILMMGMMMMVVRGVLTCNNGVTISIIPEDLLRNNRYSGGQ